MLARAIMAGTKLGVFEALAKRPLTCDEVAERCGTDRRATAKLLNALIGAGCVRSAGGRYTLTPAARRGLLESSPNSWRDQTLLHSWSGAGGTTARTTCGPGSRSASTTT